MKRSFSRKKSYGFKSLERIGSGWGVRTLLSYMLKPLLGASGIKFMVFILLLITDVDIQMF